MCRHNVSCPCMSPNFWSHMLCMYAFVRWCAHEHYVCAQSYLRGNARMCVHEQNVCSLALLRVNACMWIVHAWTTNCWQFLLPYDSFVCANKVHAHSHCCGDACMCVRVGINACMFVCICMNKAYFHTVIPARWFMYEHVCVCMNKAYCYKVMHIWAYLCVHE